MGPPGKGRDARLGQPRDLARRVFPQPQRRQQQAADDTLDTSATQVKRAERIASPARALARRAAVAQMRIARLCRVNSI